MDMNEIVCNCMDVSVQNIADAIKDGAASFEDVQEATGAGTVCGGCEDSVKEIVEKLLSQK